MMRNWTTKHALMAGIVLLLVSNTVALSGVYYNRSGEPDSTLMLTDREFWLPYRSRHRKENSGLALRLRWKVVRPASATGSTYTYYYSSHTPEWLDEAKLAALGFDLEVEKIKREKRQSRHRILPRDVLLVMEHDGEAYALDLKRAGQHLNKERDLVTRNPGKKEFTRRLKNAEQHYKRLQETESRLYVIDAGLDREALRKKYPNRSKFLIVGGRVRAWLQYRHKEKKSTITGYLAGINVTHVNVAKQFHVDLEEARQDKKRRKDSGKTPGYAFKVAWGKRLEPWLQEIVLLSR